MQSRAGVRGLNTVLTLVSIFFSRTAASMDVDAALVYPEMTELSRETARLIIIYNKYLLMPG